MAKTHVLVAVDFSEESLRSIPVAKALVRAFDADLTVVHAVAPGGARRSLIPGMASAPSPERMMHSEREEALLSRLRAEQLADVEGVTLQLISGESAAQAIVDQARRMHSDFIVLSKHGRRGISRALLGGVTEEVVRHAHCPVVVVPASGAS
jgi:nucleotide-binding universal stress UspA family protein